MAGIKVETDLAKLPVWIDKKVLKQIKYASSVALYETAVEAQNVVKANLSDRFTIRTPWVEKGIRVRPGSSRMIRSSGQSLAGMQAEVGTVDAFMRFQEEGGVKDAKKKSRRMGIPKRTTAGEIIDKSKWPKALLKKPGYFFWTRSDGRAFVFHRTTRNRYPIELKYSFAESVKIPPRWNLKEQVEEVANKRFMPLFYDAFDRAMKTAR